MHIQEVSSDEKMKILRNTFAAPSASSIKLHYSIAIPDDRTSALSAIVDELENIEAKVMFSNWPNAKSNGKFLGSYMDPTTGMCAPVTHLNVHWFCPLTLWLDRFRRGSDIDNGNNARYVVGRDNGILSAKILDGGKT